MTGPKFNPNQPFEEVEQLSDVPKFEAGQPFEEVGQAKGEQKQSKKSQKEAEEMSVFERYARGSLAALPMAGAMAGGVLAVPLGPAGMALGAGLGAAGGKALENIGEQALGDEKTYREIYVEPIEEGLMGAAGEGAGQVVAKGVQSAKGLYKPFFRQFSEKPKMFSEGIKEASERLGTKPTRGMLTESELRQGMESSISQSPYSPGKAIRKQYENVSDTMSKQAKQVLLPKEEVLSPVMTGADVKGKLSKQIAKKLKPAIEVYNQIAEVSPNLPIDDIKNVADRVRQLKLGKFKTGGVKSVVNDFADDINEITSLEDLRTLKTIVRESYQAAKQSGDGAKKYALSKIKSELIEMEQKALQKAAMGPQKQALDEANKLYGQTSEKLKSLGKSFRLGKVNNYEDFLRKVEELPDEQLAERLFNTKDINSMNLFKQEFPEAFKSVQDFKLSQIYEKSLTKGDISFPKLINNVNKMTKESKEILFGKEGLQTLDDIKTLYNNFPPKMGPSGTPQGQDFRDLNPIDPRTWVNEAKVRLQQWILENPEKASALGEKIIKSKASEASLRGFKYQGIKEMIKPEGEPIKRKSDNYAKWEKQGFDKIKQYTGLRRYDSLLSNEDKKIKVLLRQASSSKPGTKRFEAILKQIDERLGE